MIDLFSVCTIFISSNLYSSTISTFFSPFFLESLFCSSLPQIPLHILNIAPNIAIKIIKENGIPNIEENIICTKTNFFEFASKLSKKVSNIPHIALSKFSSKDESKILLLLKTPNAENN